MASKLLHFYKGAAVATTTDDDAIIYIKSGFVKRQTISGFGRFNIQIIYGPQDIFSLTKIYKILLGQEIYGGRGTYYFQALSDVQAYRLNSKALIGAVAKDPGLYRELFAEAGRHLRGSVNNLEIISLSTTLARVAHQLAYFAQEFGRPVETGVEIQLPISQQDLADLLSVTRETVARSVSQLRKKRLITEVNQRFVILDIEKLTELAYS